MFASFSTPEKYPGLTHQSTGPARVLRRSGDFKRECLLSESRTGSCVSETDQHDRQFRARIGHCCFSLKTDRQTHLGVCFHPICAVLLFNPS